MAVEVARVHGLICSHVRDDPFSIVSGGEKGCSEGAGKAEDEAQLCCQFRVQAVASAGSAAAFSSLLQTSPCSSQAESDEDDDYVAELAEQIAYSMLEDDDSACDKVQSSSTKSYSGNGFKVAAPSLASGWPRSSSSWSSGSAASSIVSSSEGSSQVSSPPATPVEAAQHDALGLLYAAAGEVVRLKKGEEMKASAAGNAREALRHNTAAWSQPSLQLPTNPCLAKPSACSNLNSLKAAVTKEREKPVCPSHSHRAWTSYARHEDANLSTNQANHRPAKQGAASVCHSRRSQQLQNRQGGKGGYKGPGRLVRSAHPASGSPQWSASVVNGGSGLRAVFLSSTGTGRESGGTGVFLPRCIGSCPDNRRKPVCSTVLLPSRVVQVLNLNVEDMRPQPTSSPHLCGRQSTKRDCTFPGGGVSSASCSVGSPSYAHDYNGLKRSSMSGTSQLRQSGAELSLPSEWTY